MVHGDPKRSAFWSQEKHIFGDPMKFLWPDIGIAGYLLLGLLALGNGGDCWRRLPFRLGFFFYLAYIEKDILEKWCIYCVISLGIITLIMLLSLVALGMDWRKTRPRRAEQRKYAFEKANL